MKRIYIAGKLNADACGYVQNIHRMVVWAEKVRRAGFAVFVPGIDFLNGVILGDWAYLDYFENSQPWLDASDAVFLVPGWETSEGVKREIARADAQGIPVYFNLDALIRDLNNTR